MCRLNGPYALRSFRESRVSSELEEDQKRLLRLGGDLLGGDRLGDILLGSPAVAGRFDADRVPGDMEREGRGLSPLLLGVGEGIAWVGLMSAPVPDPLGVDFVPRLTTSVVEPCGAGW